ncbi:MAG: hypothetical protein ACNA8G_09075 [Gammaproteobacteria bacterium]
MTLDDSPRVLVGRGIRHRDAYAGRVNAEQGGDLLCAVALLAANFDESI